MSLQSRFVGCGEGESFLLPSPGRLSMGLKTQRRLSPRPSSAGLIVSFVKLEEGMVAATI
ncbi:hypothetical protein V3C10_00060 [[Clostridium] symbiosum]|uniref:hypothetical protein n=1 Tax=Clostridium symbiosum TaxID=1512 RepID=UPI001D062438|nr:hypothetical protein [[Clostridium] symbiosum]MCB6931277.1 hypothetical protein [[Clostridium] symbiosum]